MQDPMALVTTDELQERLSFDMDDLELREAEGALAYLSDEARDIGDSTWETGPLTPRQVQNIIIKAAARHMKNHEGYITSRAGDEDVRFADRGEAMGDPVFNAAERRSLKELGGNYASGFHSVGMVAFQTKDSPYSNTSYVPVAGGGEFPYGHVSRPW